MWRSFRTCSALLAVMTLLSANALPPERGTVAALDLAQAFGTHLPWRFTALQGPDIPDPQGISGELAPGVIRLCVSADSQRTCVPDLRQMLTIATGSDDFSEPHFLDYAGLVHPSASDTLLLVSVASLHSGDGDQRRATVALAYDKVRERFATVYAKQTGRNNNQEVRYIADGPLRGDIISAEPTNGAPFGFWITVNKFQPANAYEPILRYRSATRYADGNPLAVIDSELPNIEQRLGLWKPGAKLPLPKGKCANPRLIHQELWC